MEFQEKADLEDADLTTSCQDLDCCSFVGDLSPPAMMCWWSWCRPMNNVPLGTSSDMNRLEKHIPLSMSESCKTRSSIGNG